MFTYFENLLDLYVSMSFYMVIGLLFTGFLHAFINEAWIKKQLGKKSIASIIKASLIGVPLPLCSCGVVPMAVYLREQGASRGAVMSFLTSTPQTGVDSLIASYGLLGPVFAIYRAAAAFISGVLTGLFVELLGKEKVRAQEGKGCCCHSQKKAAAPAKTCCCHKTASRIGAESSLAQKIKEMFRFAFVEFLDKITINFIFGLLIAAAIASLIPADLFSAIQHPLLGMLLALLIGIPMYVCSTASIPIALALILKGFSPGAAFVFLFVGPATNIASLSVLLKAFSKKSIAIYLISLSLCALMFGYILDCVCGQFVLADVRQLQSCDKSVLSLAVAGLFAFLLVLSLYRYCRKRRAVKKG